MSHTTTSTIFRNLPEFPYSPAPAARNPLSSLLSSSHFVTTFVFPPHHPSSPPAVEEPPSFSPADPADPHQEYADFLSAQASPLPSSPSQSPTPTEHLSVPIETLISERLKLPLPCAESSKRPFSFLSARRLQSSKHFSSSTSIFKQRSPALIEAGNIFSPTTRCRRRSSWHSFKRMGNRIATPLRSLGVCCITGRAAMSFGEDSSSDDSSLGCSSGEYPPEFIRAVLENNVLLGHLTVD